MKAILVHAENIYQGLENLFSPALILSFKYKGGEDIDIKLADFVEKQISPKNPSSIFIKTSLSENNTEFLGLRLACYIRLSEDNRLSRVPIVLIGEESYEDLLKLFEYPGILATKGLYLSRSAPKEIKNFLDDRKLEACPSIKEFAEKINISVPDNYLSRHSIANEWSILRWAEALKIGLDDPPLKDIKDKIQGQLYYKYLLARHPEITKPETLPKLNFNQKEKVKVLLIDDESDKGWKKIFEKIFSSDDAKNIGFIPFGESFRSSKQDQILAMIEEKVNSENPDVIILDLRLTGKDFENTNQPDALTGYQALKKIKKINPGYQVIIFTASNKVWNLLELQKAGANRFILKESPELSVNKDYARDSIEALAESIKYCLNSAYLKEIYSYSESIKKAINQNRINKIYFDKTIEQQLKGKELQELIKKDLDIIYSILSSNDENKLDLSVIVMVMILECISKIIFRVERDNNKVVFWNGNEIEYYDHNKKTFIYNNVEFNKISSLGNKIHNIIKRFNIVSSESKDDCHDLIHRLIEHRNSIIHPKQLKQPKNSISAKNIIEWLGLIKDILAKIA